MKNKNYILEEALPDLDEREPLGGTFERTLIVEAKEPFGVAFVIPSRTKFFWVATHGRWIWHPGQGECGPEGVGGPAGPGANIEPAPAGSLCGYNPNINKVYIYEARFDISRGGKSAYANQSNEDITCLFLCNDAVGQYNDNSGSITSTIRFISLP